MYMPPTVELKKDPFAPPPSSTSSAQHSSAPGFSPIHASVKGAGQGAAAAELFALYADPAPIHLKEGTRSPIKEQKHSASELTGIGSSLAVGRYVASAKQIQADWEKLTPKQRAERFNQAASDELTRIGVPSPKVELADLGSRAGEFSSKPWRMKLGQGPLGQSEVADGQAASVADTVYHESRHAEQFFRMARLLAGQRKPAADIADELDIPTEVAAAAKEKPLDAKSTEGKEAQGFYDSNSGKGMEHRDHVFREMAVRKLARKEAEDEVVKVRDDPKSTPAEQEAAERSWQDARKAWKNIYQQYLALPEEADAWKVGGAVSDKYLEKK